LLKKYTPISAFLTAKEQPLFGEWMMFVPKNIPNLAPFSNKYPLQRDIFCINEASLLCEPFGPLWSFAPCVAPMCGALLLNMKLCFWLALKEVAFWLLVWPWLCFGLL
jgi:hypothetical protein